ncbi:unnamed protein product [[Actinomadura] parvosata subsp. kistnae]|uniref:hypothetical protein n=1 Tax=[Actinomadura] parvosata TaxID=1955412 RepID=UPI000D2B7FE9|nr:unnamed protein product [Actinomadura parvosata subsp. kistnae]
MLADTRTALPAQRRATALADHRAFMVLLALAAALRLVTMLGYRPATLYWYDSFTYLDTAVHPAPSATFHPIGYPLLLRALLPFHNVDLIAAVQHTLGLATAILLYAVLRRRSAPAWPATTATAPLLLDASFLRLEHAVLSDTQFIFLITAALAALLWNPTLSLRATATAGLLFAAATLTRTIALPLLLLVGLVLAAQRAGLRRLTALTVAAALPLSGYATWYAVCHGRFAISGADGVALWARTMTFADCVRIQPPPDLAVLCPNGTTTDAASEYVWAPQASLNRLPGDRFTHNGLARSFAIRAILAQPLDYLADVATDTAIAFSWTPIAHPVRVTPAFGFGHGHGDLPAQPLIDKVTREYDPDIRGQSSVSPYADLLIAYQYVAYLRGPLLGAILLLGAAAIRRPRVALLPWVVAIGLLVGPVAVLDFDHRYVLPVIPVACLAAGLFRAIPYRMVRSR